jgi:hypothetical protein
MAQQTALIQVGLARETTWGTPVASTTFFPIKAPKGFVPNYDQIDDDSFRNNLSDIQGSYQGVGRTQFDLPDMLFYPNASGFLPFAMLGADAISGAGPYTHVLTLLNSGQPTSWTLTKFDNLIATARRISGAYFNEVTMRFANPGKFTIGAKGIGKIADTAAKPAASFDAAPIFLPWQAALTLSGANTKLVDMEVSLKRGVDLIFGMNNTQDATQASVDQLSVTGKMTFVPTDDTEKGYYTSHTQPAASVLFTSGANTLTLQMTKCTFTDPVDIDPGSPYEKLSMSFKGVANATDAGTGNSPIKVTLVNTQATAYST